MLPRLRSAAAVPVAVCVLGGCPSGGRDGGEPRDCFVGDPSLAAELEIVHRTADGGVETTMSGGAVPLIEPPQGGKVLFVGARARNINACPVQIVASLRDECSGIILSRDERPILLEPTGDGWAQPKQAIEITNYSNLPACPRAAAERDVDGEPYLLRVRIEDEAGRVAEASMRITPFCAEPDRLDRCLCECDRDFVLGGTCSSDVDSGVPPGTCPERDAGP